MDIASMLLWILLNLFPFSVAITCSEIAQCDYDSHVYANAQVEGDISTLCSLLGKSVECLETVMVDCEKNANIQDNKLQQAQQVLEMNNKQVLALCSHLSDGSSFKSSGNEASKNGSHLTNLGIPDAVKTPTCAEIMTCMFDLDQFKTALKDNRPTEACGLINPSVKCLRLAIKDCKESKIIDNEDIASAAHSLTDAENLLESYCGYAKEKEAVTVGTNPETSEGRQAAGVDGPKQSHEGSTKQRDVESSYKTAKESNKQPLGSHSSIKRHDDPNSASGHKMPLGVLFLVLLLNIESFRRILFCNVFTDIIYIF